jgi:FkbM family methyltransferase
MIENYFCIEGDKEFFSYLKQNMKIFENVMCINTLLSDTSDKIKSLVRIHSGTASAQGKDYSDSTSFDKLTESLKINKIDLIKIDTDGYDGKILKGAENSLRMFKPMVIFEWHPILCKQAETDFYQHFRVLQRNGYKTFIWFTKFGSFSHFIYEPSDKYIEQFAEICIKAEFDNDWHYDIVTFHENTSFSILEFANSTFSRNKKSQF